MFSFKKWLQNENLAGPGGGPELTPDSQELLAKNHSSRGAGAFPTFGDSPEVKQATATTDYLDPRFSRKNMAKDSREVVFSGKKTKKSIQEPHHLSVKTL